MCAGCPQDNAALALDKYSAAISSFMWFDRGPDKRGEDIPLVDSVKKIQDPVIKQQVGARGHA